MAATLFYRVVAPRIHYTAAPKMSYRSSSEAAKELSNFTVFILNAVSPDLVLPDSVEKSVNDSLVGCDLHEFAHWIGAIGK